MTEHAGFIVFDTQITYSGTIRKQNLPERAGNRTNKNRRKKIWQITEISS